MAEPRIPLVVPGTRSELAELERRITQARGRISPLYQALLNSASIAAGWETFLTAVRTRTSVPPALRELVILRIAVLNRAPFEFRAHVPHAIEAGVGEDKIEAVKSTPVATLFDDDERLVLAYADAMTRNVEVDDRLFADVARRFDATMLVELTATIAAYNMVSRFLVALHIGMDDQNDGS